MGGIPKRVLGRSWMEEKEGEKWYNSVSVKKPILKSEKNLT